MFIIKIAIIVVLSLKYVDSSLGDQTPFYKKCLKTCFNHNCTSDTSSLKTSLFQWPCKDECRYECMWKTVDAFHERNWKTPQFNGKWPFVRILGLQEPASVFFSLLNFYVHFVMLRRFRKNVKSTSPFYWLWHAFCMTWLNAWVWSTIFHARDTYFTELMDYTSAFSTVLMSCYCMLMRLLRNSPRFVLITITTFFVAFLANHIAYLSMGKFDYAYNMEVNILIGTFTAICWFGWCIYNRIRQPYVWKCAVFVALAGIAMLLEIIDLPPIFWIFDCHSLWHLATAPLTCLFYSFTIDDCNYLRKMQIEPKKKI